jgi:hypothetical protein
MASAQQARSARLVAAAEELNAIVDRWEREHDGVGHVAAKRELLAASADYFRNHAGEPGREIADHMDAAATGPMK